MKRTIKWLHNICYCVFDQWIILKVVSCVPQFGQHLYHLACLYVGEELCEQCWWSYEVVWRFSSEAAVVYATWGITGLRSVAAEEINGNVRKFIFADCCLANSYMSGQYEAWTIWWMTMSCNKLTTSKRNAHRHTKKTDPETDFCNIVSGGEMPCQKIERRWNCSTRPFHLTLVTVFTDLDAKLKLFLK